MSNTIAILGIHTGIGKTIASAVMAEALDADYWKPVQAGLEECDTDTVARLITNGRNRVHPEAVRLSQPLSPHAAAAIDGVVIDHTRFCIPATNKLLLVETAGGVLSPISDVATMADFVAYFGMPAILVVQHYLGSINHTLLCTEVLKNRGINLSCIIVNGDSNKASETFIEAYSGVPIIAHIPNFGTIDQLSVAATAAQIKQQLSDHLSYGNNQRTRS